MRTSVSTVPFSSRAHIFPSARVSVLPNIEYVLTSRPFTTWNNVYFDCLSNYRGCQLSAILWVNPSACLCARLYAQVAACHVMTITRQDDILVFLHRNRTIGSFGFGWWTLLWRMTVKHQRRVIRHFLCSKTWRTDTLQSRRIPTRVNVSLLP